MSKFDRLFIAEKPSLAQGIAEAIGEMNSVKATKADGYWVVGNDRVAWLFGHMLELAEPKAYGEKWEKWSIDTLPIVVDEGDWKLNENEKTKDQLRKVKNILRDANVIVSAGDAGREGQLLVDEVVINSGIDAFKPNIKRLWVQSMARKDMIASLNSLLPNAQKRSLYESAIGRQRADWQHGMTFSRLYTILARNSGSDAKISVGRVQTPTLRLVVDRDRERAKFKPVDHFLPKIIFRHVNGAFSASWVIPADYEGVDSEGRLIDKKVAEALIAKISGKQGKVRAFKSETKYTPPPLPYSLSALQAECGPKFGLTAKETLDVAQSLYEKHKATTYPRSDSRHLPVAILKDEAPSIMRALTGTPGLQDVAKGSDMSLRSAAWDDSKVSDHHGIIPTSEFSAAKLNQMDDIERKVFLLIAKAFIAQFYPPFKYKALSAEISCEGEAFKANGRQIVDQGWKTVYGAAELDDEDDKDDEAKQALPVMAQGDPVQAEKGDISSKRTSPPPAFTDGTLITAMANVHRFVTNPETKKRLKESDGIGTEATRAETIETLLRRGFLKREGKTTLKSTPLGQSIIDVLPEDLKDPGLTALWESALQRVEKGEMPLSKFMEAQTKSLIEAVANARGSTVVVKGASTVRPVEGHGETCPKCSIGLLVTQEIHKGEHKGKKFLRCSNQPDCDYRRWPQPKVDPLPGHGKDCPKCGKGKMLTREVSGKIDKTRKYRLLACSLYPTCDHSEFPERPKVEPLEGDGKPCPKCASEMKTFVVSKDGPRKGQRFLGCTNRECKTIEFMVVPLPGHGKACPKCSDGKMLTKEITSKKDNQTYRLLECSNRPTCDSTEWPERPKVAPMQGDGKPCPECKTGVMRTAEYKDKKDGTVKKYLRCDSTSGCRFVDWGPKSSDSSKSSTNTAARSSSRVASRR